MAVRSAPSMTKAGARPWSSRGIKDRADASFRGAKLTVGRGGPWRWRRRQRRVLLGSTGRPTVARGAASLGERCYDSIVSAVASPRAYSPPRDARGVPIDLRPVQPLLDRIVSSWRPREIWLFGSRARGTASRDSDWDLLVVVPDDLAPDGFDDPMTVWKVKQGTGVRADVLVCRASEFDEDRGTHNTIAYDAAVEGVRIS